VHKGNQTFPYIYVYLFCHWLIPLLRVMHKIPVLCFLVILTLSK